jgi:hypothetical protein
VRKTRKNGGAAQEELASRGRIAALKCRCSGPEADMRILFQYRAKKYSDGKKFKTCFISHHIDGIDTT